MSARRPLHARLVAISQREMATNVEEKLLSRPLHLAENARARPLGRARFASGEVVKCVLLALVVVALVCVVGTRRAAAAPTSTGFALNRYHPADPGSDWFAADSLDFRGRVRPGVGLVADFANRP